MDDNRYIIISKVLTGHLYYNSIYETSDSCGNCDGAKCGNCKTKYLVEDLMNDKMLYFGDDIEEMKRIAIEAGRDPEHIEKVVRWF